MKSGITRAMKGGITNTGQLYLIDQLMGWIERDPFYALQDLPVFISYIQPLEARAFVKQLWKDSLCDYANRMQALALMQDPRTYSV